MKDSYWNLYGHECSLLVFAQGIRVYSPGPEHRRMVHVWHQFYWRLTRPLAEELGRSHRLASGVGHEDSGGCHRCYYSK